MFISFIIVDKAAKKNRKYKSDIKKMEQGEYAVKRNGCKSQKMYLFVGRTPTFSSRNLSTRFKSPDNQQRTRILHL